MTKTGQEIAAYLGKPLRGPSVPVERAGDLAACGPGDLVWVKAFTPERLALLEARRPALAICDETTAARTTVAAVATARPRLDFIKAVTRFFVTKGPAAIHPTAIVEPGARLGREVALGAYSRIGAQVTIGDGCAIGSGVAVEGEVELGPGCVVKPNAVIGAPGFGFELDEDGTPWHFPHLGKVVLEEGVWLGSCSTIERATLGVTRLCRGVKVDDLVQIGHNTTIGASSLVMANAIICGGAVVGERCWIAPNSVVKQGVRLGNEVTVGLGAVVLKDVADGLTVAGVPARSLERKG